MREEGRNADLRRIVERLARAPVLAAVLLHAVRRAQHRRVLLRRCRIARERRLGPGLEPAGRDEIGFLLLRHALQPAVLRRRHRHLAVGAERPARVGERGAGAYPRRSVEDELRDLDVVLRGIPAHDARAPGPAHEVDFRDAAAPADEVHRGRDVFYRGLGAHDGRVLLGRLLHLRGTRRSSVAAHVHEVHVVAAPRDVIHPRLPAQAQVERGLGRVGRAVDEEQDPVAGEFLRALGVLVAHIEPDAGVRCRHHEFFHIDLRRPGRDGGETKAARGQRRERMQDDLHFSPFHSLYLRNSSGKASENAGT